MQEDKFPLFLNQQIQALKILLNAGLITPFLMLIYTSIEILGFITDAKASSASNQLFQAFVDTYMLRYLPGMTSADLWGARCGLLHANSPESNFSKQSKAKQILYSWGTASHDVAKQVIESRDCGDRNIDLKVEDLLAAFLRGVADFENIMKQNEKLSNLVRERSTGFYCDIPIK